MKRCKGKTNISNGKTDSPTIFAESNLESSTFSSIVGGARWSRNNSPFLEPPLLVSELGVLLPDVGILMRTSPIGQRCGIHAFPHQFFHASGLVQHKIMRESHEMSLILFSGGVSDGWTDVSSVYFVSNDC